MNCSIITIGTELLIGQVIDTNAAYLGEQLNSMGIQVVSRYTVSDIRENMLLTFTRAAEDADLILITGGLGPTRDDITKKVLAEFLDVPMYFDESQYELITEFFSQLGRQPTEAHRQQCYFPEGVSFLENKMGTAQGMLFHYEGKRIVSMPGVPYEMKYIVENGIVPMLKKEQSSHILHKTVKTAGLGESLIASKIEDIEDALPAYLNLAYLPGLGQVRIRISGEGKDPVILNDEISDYTAQIVEKLGTYVFGYDLDELSVTVGNLLKERNWMLGLAESCTGGKIANLVTSMSGSSAYFEGGVVSYTNELKNHLLHVSEDTLKKYGAVSEQVVKQMVAGTIDLLNVDVAIAVSGIAGPTGGSEEKPVGTVWICVGNKDVVYTKKLQLTKDRNKNISYSANAALNFLRLFLLEKVELSKNNEVHNMKNA